MIQLKNVTKTFSGTRVLDGISFSVPESAAVALLGLSGSGKTTALKIICGLHTPDSGEVLLNGCRISKENLQEVRRNMGYVIQDGGLFPHLTAWENISLVAKEASWSAEKTRNRIEELSALTQLPAALLSRYPRELSGGQRQRVGLMRALLLDPPILLLDEPLGALDPITRNELQQELKALFRSLKKTVILVTHDLFEAGFLADSIVLLNGGRVAQEGKLDALIQRPADEFVGRFVGSQRRVEA